MNGAQIEGEGGKKQEPRKIEDLLYTFIQPSIPNFGVESSARKKSERENGKKYTLGDALDETNAVDNVLCTCRKRKKGLSLLDKESYLYAASGIGRKSGYWSA